MKSNQNQQWVMMVYLAADNSLSEECVYSLKEMQRIGAGPRVRVAAQFDSSAQGVAIKRYFFRENGRGRGLKGGDEDGTLDQIAVTVTKPKSARAVRERRSIAAENGRRLERSADPEVLRAFLDSVIDYSNQEARHLVVLSGHGGGVAGEFLSDHDPPSSMEVPQLRHAFEPVTKHLRRKIDILGMDTCLMSMAEVGVELAGAVQFLVGAEGFTLSTGWPYHRVLEALHADPDSSPESLAETIVEKYLRYYSDYIVAGVSVDFSCCDLTRVDNLVGAVKTLTRRLRAGLKDGRILEAILLAHWRAQSYYFEQYVDLYDFCDLLGQGSPDPGLAAACEEVKAAIEGDGQRGWAPLVRKSGFRGAAFQHSHGLSIYFPWAAETAEVANFKDLKNYRRLAFHKATRWGSFVAEYLEASRRKMRGEPEGAADRLPKTCIIAATEETVVTHRVEPLSGRGGFRITRVKNPPVCFLTGEEKRAGKVRRR